MLNPVDFTEEWVFKDGGGSVEFHLHILSVFCAGVMHFCSPFFLFQAVLPRNFPDLFLTLPYYRDLSHDINIFGW